MTEEFEPQIEAAAEKTPYSVDAFHFVLQGLTLSQLQDGSIRHITAAELCYLLRDQAIARFGSAAQDQLESWGVRSTDDFGRIVDALVSVGLAARSEDDKKEDFDAVFDFDETFRPRPLQWKLSTLFLLTTIAAVAFAGVQGRGPWGAVGALMFSWLGLIGVFLLYFAVVNRARGWLVELCLAAGFLAMGIGGFLLMTL